jgi:hypothetical protein
MYDGPGVRNFPPKRYGNGQIEGESILLHGVRT